MKLWRDVAYWGSVNHAEAYPASPFEINYYPDFGNNFLVQISCFFSFPRTLTDRALELGPANFHSPHMQVNIT